MASQDFTKSAITWSAKCISLLPNITDVTSGLVDGDGNPMTNFNNDIWGISLPLCYEHCGLLAIPLADNFRFEIFANAFTNYLLPWLGLTAQLPYETGSPWNNIMSFCLAVGSPALVTYSLTLTILNRYWVRRRYSNLSAIAAGSDVSRRYPGYSDRVRAIEYLLSEAQQVPLRASQRNGWLSSLIVHPKNQEWWKRLQVNLRNTRRGVTFSLVAQVLSAAIAWLFVIISAFQAALGDSTVALQISAGSLWVWLIPVICGWIVVGTQYSHGKIEASLVADEACLVASLSVGEGQQSVSRTPQRGIVATSGFVFSIRTNQNLSGDLQFDTQSSCNVLRSLGGDVRGDERREGPIYNYARAFTWFQFAAMMTRAVDRTLEKITYARRMQHNSNSEHQQYGQHHFDQWVETDDTLSNLQGNAADFAEYCGLKTRPYHQISAYSRLRDMWRDGDDEVFSRIAAATLAAMVVQWGTTGAAVIIAYFTPTKGFGCRSGGYVLYGLLGTMTWVLLILSMVLSHLAMIEQQLRVRKSSRCNRLWIQRTLGCAAVLTRYLGKLFAVSNSVWIILSSLFEFMGFYSNCYCMGNKLSLGSKGWVMIFKNANDLRTAANGPWAGGVTMTIFVCFFSFVFFLGSRKRE